MTTFALVHGAWHAGWHWQLVADELRGLGHRVVAPDLPIGDPGAGTAEFADVVVDAIGDDDGKVVVAGHSMGGLVIPLVASRRPVDLLVFVCALIPEPGVSFREQAQRERILSDELIGGQVRGDDGLVSWPADGASAVFYGHCPPDLAAEAIRRLRRQSGRPTGEPSPLAAWPDVRVASIVARDDRAVLPEWSRQAARARLGVEPIEIDGDHSPFLNQPAALARLLASLSQRPG